MAIHIEWRNGTAAAWTSANPILAIGELGDETDTGQFKIGDGVTAWNSLAYQSSTGPTQTIPYSSMGDGSDGNVTVSSGTTTLTQDMYYNNLTINGSGVIVTNGYKIFVKGILDISAAPIGAIQWNGNAGGNASGATGGTAPAAQPGGTVAAINQGGSGTTATTGNGTAGGAGTIGAASNGGVSGVGGGGGTGTSGTGGAGSAARTPSANNPFLIYQTNFLDGATLMSGGSGAGGGGAGAGDGTNNGGGSGAGGNGGGLVVLYANSIVKSSSTLAGTIQANGGIGGNGGNTSAGVTGGGGGGGGGAGGWVYIAYNFLFGPVITALVQANGGNGGTGGNGTGSGATGGAGGNSGSGGRINIINITASTANNLLGISNLTLMPELVGYTPVLGTTSVVLAGGDGGFNGMRTASL